MPPEFVVPASEVLTVLHRKGDAPARPVELATAEPVDGWTSCCRRPMLLAETWVAIDRVTGDAVCGEASVPGSAAAAGEDVEVTLW